MAGRLWLTSDWHLRHNNIIRYCKRPYRNTDEMESALLRRYNECVDSDDEVWFLGDLAMTKGGYNLSAVRDVVAQMRGRKHMILGNHDKLKVRSYLSMGFASVHTAAVFWYDEQPVLIVHSPADIYFYPHEAAWGVCGHVHDKWKVKKEGPLLLVNVSVEVWDYRPVLWGEIVRQVERYHDRPWRHRPVYVAG